MNGHFTNAIEVLGCDVADMEACVGPRPGGCKDHTDRIIEFKSAIRILEIASEMDKPALKEFIKWVGCPSSIDNIVKALPDKEKT
jgi:hypothetical protein